MVQNVGDNEITRVTSVRTISDAMNTSTIYKSMLSEVDKLLKLYYTFPVLLLLQNGHSLLYVE